MTKKDFELIAATLKATRPPQQMENEFAISQQTMQHLIICREIADALATTNPRFDRERFLAACGVQ